MSNPRSFYRKFPITLDGVATVLLKGDSLTAADWNDPLSGTTTDTVIKCLGYWDYAVIQCITTSSLAWKVLVSYDNATSFEPVRSIDANSAQTAANSAVTPSANDISAFNLLAATHVKVSRTAGSGTISFVAAGGQLPVMTQGTSAATLEAGTNVVGGVFLDSFSVKVTPTVATAAYIAGDSVGGILTFASAGAINARQIAIDEVFVSVLTTTANAPPLTIEWFTSTPTGGTYTDGAPLVYAAGDTALARGYTQVLAANYKGFPTHATPIKYVACVSGPLGTIPLAATSLFALVHADESFTLTAGDVQITASGRRL